MGSRALSTVAIIQLITPRDNAAWYNLGKCQQMIGRTAVNLNHGGNNTCMYLIDYFSSIRLKYPSLLPSISIADLFCTF